MRLLCPNCQKELQVDDRYAGQLMKCPLCTGTFTVPMLPSMPGAAAPPPPPPPPQGPAPLPPIQMHAPAASGGQAGQQPAVDTGPRHSLSISPRLITWLAPFSLIVVFVLMFFPWVGMYPGGIGVVTQSGWGVAFGSTSVDKDWDQEAMGSKVWDSKLYYGTSATAVQENIRKLKEPGASGYTILFAVLLIFAMLLSVGSTAISQKLISMQPPAALAPVWGMRSLIVAALATSALVLIILQSWSGSALEAQAVTQVRDAFKTDRATAISDTAKKRWDIEEGIVVGGYGVHTTRWLSLVIFFNALAVLGGVMDYLVERKGPQGMPQLNWAGS